MKKTLTLLAWVLIGLLPIKAFTQCTFVSPTVDIKSTQTSGLNCTIVFDLAFDLVTNSGNKIIFVHLWKTADYPSLPYSNAPTAAELSNTVLNVIIDNFGTPVLLCSYSPAPSVTVQCPTNNAPMVLSKFAGQGASGSDRFVINNVSITVPGACNSSFTFKGDAWSSNANSSNPVVQCSMLGFGIGLNDPLVSGFCVSPTPAAGYNFNIATTSSSLQVYYDVYLDGPVGAGTGDGVLVPSQDILIGSLPITTPVSITPTTPFNSGTIAYPAAYNTLTYAGRKVYVVVATIGRSYLLSAEIAPCGVSIYDFGDLPTTGSPSWPLARVGITGAYDNGTLKLDNSVISNTNAVWAGNAVGVRTTPFHNCADGKSPNINCDFNDDGLGIPGIPLNGGYTYPFAITINGNLAGLTAYYGLWFDWNNDGNFSNDVDGNGQPAFYSGNATTQSPRTIGVGVKPPVGAVTDYKSRLIVSGSPVTSTMFNATNLVNGEVEDYNAPAVIILPLTFKNVTAVNRNCNVDLNFSAGNEINNRFFRIEQSHDNINWHVIATINSKGDGDNNYQYTDTKPATGANYYRIQQVDVNAIYSYSKTISINNDCNIKGAVVIYPTLVKNNLTVNLPMGMQGATIKVLSGSGQVVLFDKGTSTLRHINASGLQAGVYIVQVINNNELIEVKKIIKN